MKQVVKIILAAAAVAAFAVPAMAANDKLIVNGTGGTPVFKVDDAGVATATKIGLGTTSPVSSFHSSEFSTDAARGIMASQHNDGGHGASIVFRKSRGSEASPTPPSTVNDYIGLFQAQYWNGNTSTTPGAYYDRAAQFGFRNDGVASYAGPALADSTGVPVAIMFFTGGSTQAGDPNIMTERFRISSKGNVVAGNSGGVASGTLALTANDGFLYIPSAAGLVTSCATATQYTGHVPIWYDTTNNKLCTCNGTVRKCAPTAFN